MEIEEKIYEYCYNCKRWLLEKFTFEKQCHNCQQIIKIYDIPDVWWGRKKFKSKERRIDFESKQKELEKMIWKLQQRIIPNEWIVNAIYVLNYQFDEVLNGQLLSDGRRYKKGKWRTISNDKIEKHLCLWLNDLYGRKIPNYNWITEFEFFNRIYEKPPLTKEDFEKISKLFFDYLTFLCGYHIYEYTTTINYKIFFAKAFKYLNIDALVIYPKVSDKNTQKFYDDLWELFILKIKSIKTEEKDYDKVLDNPEKALHDFIPIIGNYKKIYNFNPRHFFFYNK